MGDGGAVVIVVFHSVSGSPGASVWSVLAPGLWSSGKEAEHVVVEADLAGGVMGARYQVDAMTDLLMTEARTWSPGSTITPSLFASKVADRVWLVPGPKTPEAATRLWHTESGATSIADMAAVDRRVWLFDVGRATPSGVLGPLFAEAAMTVLFVRGYAEELAKVRQRLVDLRATKSHITVAVTGNCVHSHDEVTEFLGTKHVSFLPDDGQLIEDSRTVWAGRRGRRRGVWAAGAEFTANIDEVLAYSPRGEMRVVSEVS